MTATTFTHLPGAKGGASFGGWLSRVFWRIVEARENQVRQRIARQFNGLNDEYLARLGYSPVDIARVRRG